MGPRPALALFLLQGSGLVEALGEALASPCALPQASAAPMLAKTLHHALPARRAACPTAA